jgi:hypothetical protein
MLALCKHGSCLRAEKSFSAKSVWCKLQSQATKANSKQDTKMKSGLKNANIYYCCLSTSGEAHAGNL